MGGRSHLNTTDLDIGTILANADMTIVIATYSTILSELGSMENASWLVVTYSLSMCAIQPTVRCRGKDIDPIRKADMSLGSMVS